MQIESVGHGWGLRFCISIQLPGDAEAFGPWTIPGVARMQQGALGKDRPPGQPDQQNNCTVRASYPHIQLYNMFSNWKRTSLTFEALIYAFALSSQIANTPSMENN